MRSSLFRSFACSGALVLGLGAGASEAAIDLASAIAGMSEASVATVVLVPPMAVYQVALDQTGLQNAGCHYTSNDPGAIRVLAGIVTSAEVAVNPVYQRADLREGVYFTMANGGRFSVLFTDKATSRLPAMGVAETSSGGQVQSAAVSARPSLASEVRRWAKAHGGAGTGTGSACDLQLQVAEDPKAPPPVPVVPR